MSDETLREMSLRQDRDDAKAALERTVVDLEYQTRTCQALREAFDEMKAEYEAERDDARRRLAEATKLLERWYAVFTPPAHRKLVEATRAFLAAGTPTAEPPPLTTFPEKFARFVTDTKPGASRPTALDAAAFYVGKCRACGASTNLFPCNHCGDGLLDIIPTKPIALDDVEPPAGPVCASCGGRKTVGSGDGTEDYCPTCKGTGKAVPHGT